MRKAAPTPFGWSRRWGIGGWLIRSGSPACAASGRHGVLAHEQEFGQEFIADVTLDVVLDDAAASDDLADTIDYGQVAQLVHDRLVGNRINCSST